MKKCNRRLKKRGREVPGPLKKVLGLLDFFGPGTTGPSRSLGPVLSRPVLGPSRDIPGRNSPAGKPNTDGKLEPPKTTKSHVST